MWGHNTRHAVETAISRAKDPTALWEKLPMMCDCEEREARFRVVISTIDGEVLEMIETCGRCLLDLFHKEALSSAVIAQLRSEGEQSA